MQIPVPFIDLKRVEAGFHDALMSKLAAMAAAAEFIGGPEINRFEERLQRALQVRHVIPCANGTDALQLALRAVGVGQGDIVLVPNFTFWATFEAVVNVGARPVTVDVDLSDGGVCFASFEAALRETKPKAALIAHLFGWGSARLQELRNLCRSQGVPLIEDGAQAFGTQYLGKPIFHGALVSTTSFYPAKVLGAAGDGGAVFTENDDLAVKLRQLGNHGRTSHYAYGEVGWNSRLDAFQAAFLNLALDHVYDRIASRLASADIYDKVLPELGVNQIKSPHDYRPNGYCNVCLIQDPLFKRQLESAFTECGIGFGNIYPSVMSAQPGAAAHIGGHIGGRQGERLCQSVLNLPLFPYMASHELHAVIEVVRAEVERYGNV